MKYAFTVFIWLTAINTGSTQTFNSLSDLAAYQFPLNNTTPEITRPLPSLYRRIDTIQRVGSGDENVTVTVEILASNMDGDCLRNQFTVYDGNSTSDTVIYRACGTATNITQSTSQYLILRYQGEFGGVSVVQYKYCKTTVGVTGCAASMVETVDVTTRKQLFGLQHDRKVPIPGDYRWILQAPPGYRVYMTMGGYTCKRNIDVTVYDGPNSSYPELFASETRNVGFSFQSSSNIVFVQALRECTYFFNISVMAISSEIFPCGYTPIPSVENIIVPDNGQQTWGWAGGYLDYIGTTKDLLIAKKKSTDSVIITIEAIETIYSPNCSHYWVDMFNAYCPSPDNRIARLCGGWSWQPTFKDDKNQFISFRIHRGQYKGILAVRVHTCPGDGFYIARTELRNKDVQDQSGWLDLTSSTMRTQVNPSHRFVNPQTFCHNSSNDIITTKDISAPPTDFIILTIERMMFDYGQPCPADRLIITNGDGIGARKLEETCHTRDTHNQTTYISKTNKMSITFVAKENFTKRGFQLAYTYLSHNLISRDCVEGYDAAHIRLAARFRKTEISSPPSSTSSMIGYTNSWLIIKQYPGDVLFIDVERYYATNMCNTVKIFGVKQGTCIYSL
ncbi:hypothetical protein ScPMuIL_016401 [Solemya velum]